MRKRVIAVAAFVGLAMAGAPAAADPKADMSDNQALLDELYPFVEPDAPPPGQWIDRRWQGQIGWRTRHGPAVVVWQLGDIWEAFGVRLPDGSRGDVTSTVGLGLRRPGDGDRLWVYGRIEIAPDDVAFIDGPQPKPPARPKPDAPDLAYDLANDAAFKQALSDDRFALAVYAIFKNRAFYTNDGDWLWLCGDRQAARLVAELRDHGENYQDYYLRDDFKGVWPDDAGAIRRTLQETIARHSTPHPLTLTDRPDMPFTYRDGDGKEVRVDDTATLARYQTYSQAEWEKNRPSVEALRLQMLANAEGRLAELNQNPNADVLADLRRHLTRLGWRTETEADRARLAKRALAERVALLREIYSLAERPSAPAPDWVAPRNAYSLSQFTIWRVDSNQRLSEEERTAQVPETLLDQTQKLAREGKLSRPEFELLVQRINATRTHLPDGYAVQ